MLVNSQFGQQAGNVARAAPRTSASSERPCSAAPSTTSRREWSAGPVPGAPNLPSITASSSSGVPAPLIALGVAAALLAGAAGLAALARRRAAPSDWGHGWAETRYRLSGLMESLAGRRRR